jgi:hypothetical protein
MRFSKPEIDKWAIRICIDVKNTINEDRYCGYGVD